jgi:hypothetical protein
VRRLELLRAAWAPGGELVDPPLAATGPEGIAAVVDAVLAHYPGHRFARTSELDAHHAHARYRWSLLDPAGTVVLAGTDVVTFDDGGRLVRVIGFFGEPAELVELGGGAG